MQISVLRDALYRLLEDLHTHFAFHQRPMSHKCVDEVTHAFRFSNDWFLVKIKILLEPSKHVGDFMQISFLRDRTVSITRAFTYTLYIPSTSDVPQMRA